MNKVRVLAVIVVALLAVLALIVWKPELANELRASLPAAMGKAPANRIYKWQDAEGNWQVSNRPPAQGVQYETREYDANVNVLPLPQKLRDRDGEL
jgi:hypothetical protein